MVGFDQGDRLPTPIALDRTSRRRKVNSIKAVSLGHLRWCQAGKQATFIKLFNYRTEEMTASCRHRMATQGCASSLQRKAAGRECCEERLAQRSPNSTTRAADVERYANFATENR